MELSTKLSSLEKHGEPTPKMAIKELTRKAGYRILEAKKVDTKFDRKAVMLLVEVDSTKTAVTFLPVRFEKTLDDSDLQEMTSSKRYKVRCTGVNGLLIVHLCRRCTVTCGDHMQLLVFIIVGLLTQYCVRADSVKMISVIIAAYSLYLRVIDLLSTPSPPPCPLSRSSSFTSSTVSWGSVSSGWEFFGTQNQNPRVDIQHKKKKKKTICVVVAGTAGESTRLLDFQKR
ncbi:hypothetical protein J6590_099783 [Homalodisca vitripennis]|nr:hypothetical protein J6590_099783 [Homalodisca vitripennis]